MVKSWFLQYSAQIKENIKKQELCKRAKAGIYVGAESFRKDFLLRQCKNDDGWPQMRSYTVRGRCQRPATDGMLLTQT